MTDEKQSSIAENILRKELADIKNSYPVFSYNMLKHLAYKDDIENGTIHISLDALQKFLNDKLK